MKSIISVYADPSQVDEPVYEALAAERPDRRVLLLYWNDYGTTRARLDPELGHVPVFPQSDPATSRVARVWMDSRTVGVDALAAAIAAHSPELVIINDIPTRHKFPLARRCRRLGAKVGYRSDKNALSEGVRTGLGWVLERQMYRAHFDHLFYVGQRTREYYKWPPQEGTLFPYATDAAKFSPPRDRDVRDATRAALGIPPDAFVVLCVAKFVDRENPLDVVRACVAAMARIPNLYLLAVGSGTLFPAVQSMAEEGGAGDRVKLAGYVPYADLQNYFFAADVFLHLAKKEPWGVSVSDALCAGLAVIATDCVGSALELLQGRLSKYVVPVGQPARVSDLMYEMWRRQDLAGEFQDACVMAQAYTAGATARRLAQWLT